MKKSSSFGLFVPIIFMVSTTDPNGTKKTDAILKRFNAASEAEHGAFQIRVGTLIFSGV
jgi:hypothetical protein